MYIIYLFSVIYRILSFDKGINNRLYTHFCTKTVEHTDIIRTVTVLTNCVTNHKQFAKIDKGTYVSANIILSVPQGCIIGPIVCLVYIH